MDGCVGDAIKFLQKCIGVDFELPPDCSQYPYTQNKVIEKTLRKFPVHFHKYVNIAIEYFNYKGKPESDGHAIALCVLPHDCWYPIHQNSSYGTIERLLPEGVPYLFCGCEDKIYNLFDYKKWISEFGDFGKKKDIRKDLRKIDYLINPDNTIEAVLFSRLCSKYKARKKRLVRETYRNKQLGIQRKNLSALIRASKAKVIRLEKKKNEIILLDETGKARVFKEIKDQ